ncbi:DUF2335 domain-containing protein [Desulfosarcina ovata]
MAQYQKILSGAADRIIQMAEMNQEHQHYMEKTAINKEAIKI